MKVLIVYDSFFGNTEKVAQAIGDALSPRSSVEVQRVSEVKPEQLAGLDYLIAGSPTRGFRPSPAMTAWLKDLPPAALSGVRVAAFDTRIAASDVSSRILPIFVRLFGYAADPIAARLRKKGGTQVVAPEGFLVKASEGPLKDGELDRAARWAEQVASAGLSASQALKSRPDME